MEYHTIITHEYPDLDAMLCCYLLYRYGHDRYPGIEHAKLQFCPAGTLDKTPTELETLGILAVDIGGGKLDTHPSGVQGENEKFTLSAANLVAKDVNVHERPSLQNLLEFTRLQDSCGQSLRSRNPVDHTVALPNLIKGGLLHFGEQFEAMTHFFMQVFSAIEIASQNETEMYHLVPENTFLIAIQDNIAYIPAIYNLHSCFAGYLSQKFLDKTVSVQPPPVGTNCWNDLGGFLRTTGLSDRLEIKKLADFIQRLKPGHFLLNSSLPVDNTVSMVNVLKGFACQYQQIFQTMMTQAFTLFDCFMAYEITWYEALEEYKSKCKIYPIHHLKVAAISAKNGVVTKIARWQDKADLIIYHDSQEGHVSISINKLGHLRQSTLGRLASRLRVAEMICSKQPMQESDIATYHQLGEIAGWFLHQSQKLLVHGSPKAKRNPTQIPLEEVIRLCLTEIDRNMKLSDYFCPADHCRSYDCPFYALRLPNCFFHRERIRISTTPTPSIENSCD